MSEQLFPRPEPSSPAQSDSELESTCDDAAALELVSILDQYLADLKAGRAPKRQELMARHPALESQLEACLAGMEFIHHAESAAPGKARRIGDFRIIREVGRGGMGAVFEAEQISLRRTVALKILRFGAVSDPESIERFQREAETIAKLHHTNIVPIYNVGNEHGVNYYAMQFIEGRSLAEVLAEQQGPLQASQVAEWGLQAAEALTHAHQRGVIHRDVKPSNLLLDAENRLWLTDFGLARRLDDVTLSVTGAILGTPRYMSPEQASAVHKQVDHRSDLFSLGSTLYELLTGKPAFPGDSPHDVIQRIIHAEPAPVREFTSSVPRDLETIVIKCLAKRPDQRYTDASDLAADLRAHLDGRSIRARRASWVERAARWLRRQQQSVKLAATAVTLTLVVILSAVFGWYGYGLWRQAAIKLNAAKPPLVVEILDAKDQLLRVETAPTQNSIRLPAGDYRLRVAATGELSETFDLSLPRGSDVDFMLDSRDQLLWAPRDVERAFDVVDFGTEQGLVLWNEKGIGLLRHVQPLGWTRELSAQQLPHPDQVTGFRWPWNRAWQQHSGYGPFDIRPWVAPRALDIDGRGLRDLIVAGRHQAWLMAVSGDDGTILWFAARGQDVAEPTTPLENDFGNGVRSAVLDVPILGPDCDGDGTADVIATLADIGSKPTLAQDRYVTRCWVEAISGKTGASIWTYEIPAAWFELPTGQDVPYDLRWFAGSYGGMTAGGGGNMVQRRHRIRDGGQQCERIGQHGYRPASVALVTAAGATQLAIVAGSRFVALDPATGKSEDLPVELEARPGRACQWNDVDGDGASDLVLIQRTSSATGGTRWTSPDTAQLVVWSPAKRQQLWAKNLDARWPQQPSWTVEAARWPLVVDLNGDNKCEIVVPDGHTGGNRPFSAAKVPWGSITVFAGDTGEPLWTRRLVSIDQQVDHFIAGPDVDHDGYREVYSVTLAGSEFRTYVDALSGKQGTTLWSNSVAVPPDRNTSMEYFLVAPQWWQAGADGWPQLMVQVVPGNLGDRRSVVGAFSAGTGRLAQVGHDITAVRPADLDGDGTQDLLVNVSRTPDASDQGGQVHCLRGVSGEQCVRLGDVGEPSVDCDGDGTRDLISGFPSSFLTATSGVTGARLWRSRMSEDGREFQVRSAASPGGQDVDLDGDGTADLLGWKYVSHYRRRDVPFFAVSGKTGKRLWSASDIAIQILVGVLGAEAHDLDGDGKPEVIWLAALDYGYTLRDNVSTHESQLWLFVTSGQTGKLRWSCPLSSPYGPSPGKTMQVIVSQAVVSPCVGDINGDGTADLLVPQILPDGRNLQTVAISGKDGKILWSRAYPADPSHTVSLETWVPPAICDLDGNGENEVVLVEITNVDASGVEIRPRYRVVSVRGHDGGEIWNWISACASYHGRPISGESPGELMRPRLLRTGGKQRRAAVLLPGSEGAVVLFGPDGVAHQRKANHQTSASGIWVCDADGNGVDELAFVAEGGLCVAPADQLDQPLWTHSLSSQGQHRILGIQPPGPESAPVVAVALDASDNSVLGFDAVTGRRVWSCPSTISSEAGVYIVPRHVALLDETFTLPHVYYSYGAVSRCRRAVGIQTRETELTSGQSSAISLTTDLRAREATRFGPIEAYATARDNRWARDLPWTEYQGPIWEFIASILWSLVFAVFLVVLPAACLARLVMVRHFNLRMLLTVPVVAGLFLTACFFRTPIERQFDGFLARFSAGLALSPVVIAAGLMVAWSMAGQWRRILFWCAIVLVGSCIYATVLLGVAARRDPLLPEEYYDLTGWYLVGLLGAYLASWLMVIVLSGKHLASRILRRFRKGYPFEPPAPAPTDATLAVEITRTE